MAKVNVIFNAIKAIRNKFKLNMADSTDRLQVQRELTSRFSKEDLDAAHKAATGPNKSLLSGLGKQAEEFKAFIKDSPMNKGGTTRGASLEEYASSLSKDLSDEERNKAIENYKLYLERLQKAGGPKRKGGPIQKKSKMKHGGMMKPKMMGGGMYGKKMHSYVAGGNVKDMKIMKGK